MLSLERPIPDCYWVQPIQHPVDQFLQTLLQGSEDEHEVKAQTLIH